MASSSRKSYPKRSSECSIDYSCLDYDSSTGGMSSGEEDEIDNVLIKDIIQSDYDDGEEGSGSEQQVTDDNNDDT